MQFLAILDLYRKPPIFSFKRQEKVSSLSGVLLSFGIFAIITLIFVQSDLIQKTNPNVIDKTLVYSSPSHIAHFGRGFQFVFGVMNQSRYGFIDDSIFKIEAFDVISRGSNLTYVQYKLEVCTQKQLDQANLGSLGIICFVCLKMDMIFREATLMKSIIFSRSRSDCATIKRIMEFAKVI